MRMVSSSRHQRDTVDDVVVIAGRIVDQRRGLGLADGLFVALTVTVFCLSLVASSKLHAEGVFANVLTQFCRQPGLATVGRDVDRRNAVAGVPGDATDSGCRLSRWRRWGGW